MPMNDLLDDELIQEGFQRDEQFLTFVGKKGEYYHTKKDEIEGGNLVSFNFGAMIFGLSWFVYRKMYLPFLIFASFTLMESSIAVYCYRENIVTHKQMNIYDYSMTIIYALFFGLIGNFLYIKHCKIKIDKISNKGLTNENLNLTLRDQGGTSLIGAIISLIIFFSILNGVDYLFDQM